jgi:hypothetical protein
MSFSQPQPKTREHKASISDKLRALLRVEAGEITKAQAAQELGCSRQAVSSAIKRNWVRKCQHSAQTGYNFTKKYVTIGEHPALEQQLIEWIDMVDRTYKRTKIRVSRALIISKAKEISKALEIPDFKASDGWFHRFMARYRVRRVKCHGESADVDVEKKESEMRILREQLSRFDPNCVYNMDETGLFYRFEFVLYGLIV